MPKTEANDSWKPISKRDKGLINKQIIPAKPKEFKGLTLRLRKKAKAKMLYIIAALMVDELAPVRKVYRKRNPTEIRRLFLNLIFKNLRMKNRIREVKPICKPLIARRCETPARAKTSLSVPSNSLLPKNIEARNR